MTTSLVLSLFLAAVQPAETVEPAEASDATVAKAAANDDEVEICRRKTVPHPKMQNRTKSIRICKTKDEWKEMIAARKW